jgi:hypothetical protein
LEKLGKDQERKGINPRGPGKDKWCWDLTDQTISSPTDNIFLACALEGKAGYIVYCIAWRRALRLGPRGQGVNISRTSPSISIGGFYTHFIPPKIPLDKVKTPAI